jgi:molecular chaperone GrpE
VRIYAVAGLLRDLLEILDNFERAVISLRESAGQEGELDSLRSGVGLIHQRFRDILMSQGLERIEAAGTEFDPNLHEAILQVEKEGTVPGQIAEVVQPGYRLKDLVIRPCRVIVAK